MFRAGSAAEYRWAHELFQEAMQSQLSFDIVTDTWRQKSLRRALRWIRVFVFGLSGEGAVLPGTAKPIAVTQSPGAASNSDSTPIGCLNTISTRGLSCPARFRRVPVGLLPEAVMVGGTIYKTGPINSPPGSGYLPGDLLAACNVARTHLGMAKRLLNLTAGVNPGDFEELLKDLREDHHDGTTSFRSSEAALLSHEITCQNGAEVVSAIFDQLTEANATGLQVNVGPVSEDNAHATAFAAAHQLANEFLRGEALSISGADLDRLKELVEREAWTAADRRAEEARRRREPGANTASTSSEHGAKVESSTSTSPIGQPIPDDSISQKCRKFLFDWWSRERHATLGSLNPDLHERVRKLLVHDPDALDEATYVTLVKEVRGFSKDSQHARQSESLPPSDGAPTIRYLGEKAYSIGSSLPVTVTDAEHAILQEFIATPTMDTDLLQSKAGNNRAPRILGQLTKKYNAVFSPAIRLPGRKGKGGYHVFIQDAGLKSA